MLIPVKYYCPTPTSGPVPCEWALLIDGMVLIVYLSP